ncbi:hypothetical protein [Bradyrhizobium sp. Arg816]
MQRHHDGESVGELARSYGVHHSIISCLATEV